MLKATELQDEYFTLILGGGREGRVSDLKDILNQALLGTVTQLFYCLPSLACASRLRELKIPFLRDPWVRPFTRFSISLLLFYYNDILIIIIVGISPKCLQGHGTWTHSP